MKWYCIKNRRGEYWDRRANKWGELFIFEWLPSRLDVIKMPAGGFLFEVITVGCKEVKK